MHDKVDSTCAKCGDASAKLYECAHVSIDADGTSWLCQSCFRDVLDRQRAAVEENTMRLRSVWMGFGALSLMFGVLALIMLFLLATAWPNYQNNPPPDPYFPGSPVYSPVIGGGPPS